MLTNPVIAVLAEPYKLEALYRADSALFVSQIERALQDHPNAQVLKFWQARLDTSKSHHGLSSHITARPLLYVLLLCLLATLLVKLPVLLPITETWYYFRFAPSIVITALAVFFIKPSLQLRPVTFAIITGVLVTLLAMLLLPDNAQSSSITMATIHAPLVLWSVLGLAFTASNWRSADLRIEYLRYNGELLIYTTLILLGGIAMTGLTIGLFSLIELDIEDWYTNNVVIAGLVSAPILATFLFDDVLHRNSRLATTIANVFAPLFLITIVVYLFAMVIAQKSPYSDRDFLIVINGLLLLVLGMTVFSICGRNHQSPSLLTDSINLGLVSVTLIVNMIALSAIIYRFSEWGFSPNRVVVTGANVLIFLHLLQIVRGYVSVLRQQSRGQRLIEATVGFLPIYGAWALVVMVVLPILFQFE